MLRLALGLCLTLAAFAAQPARAADLLPHEGRYVVRLGTSPTAPQVGTARQLLNMDCRIWRLERDVVTDLPLVGGFRLTSSSELRGTEPRAGAAFDYLLRREQNGRELTISGRVTVGRSGARADLVFPSRPAIVDLPADIVLPIAAFGHVIDALKGGAGSFSFRMYDPELTSDAFQVDGGTVAEDALRPVRPDRAKLPDGRTWPVEIAFSRLRAPTRPLFTALLLLHEGGILDRLTISTGLVTASADLVAFTRLPRPDCPTS